MRWSRFAAGGLSTHEEHAVDTGESWRNTSRIIEITMNDFDAFRKLGYLRATGHCAYVLATRGQLFDQLTADIPRGACDQNHR